ncbi:TfoX/Sxy family protein [Viridibacterium curvum]|uniref:TfoX/Sxy family protein n=1 Tax=Viridibacterium curvum TaxID=1101404 RepID=A0ABP9R2P4_9RHOO
MSVSADYLAWCAELLAPLGRISHKRMFSGAGLYSDGIIVAIIIDDQLFLKTDAGNVAEFEAAGSSPFTYKTKTGKETRTSYWRAPDEAMDSPALMLPWARSALAASLRAAQRKSRKK